MTNGFLQTFPLACFGQAEAVGVCLGQICLYSVQQALILGVLTRGVYFDKGREGRDMPLRKGAEKEQGKLSGIRDLYGFQDDHFCDFIGLIGMIGFGCGDHGELKCLCTGTTDLQLDLFGTGISWSDDELAAYVHGQCACKGAENPAWL